MREDNLGVKGTPKLTREDNLALYGLLVAGDKTAREKMIVGNMRLVLWKVRDYLATFFWLSHLEDDMVAAGLLGLTEAVNKLADGTAPHSDNVVAYLAINVHRGIGSIADQNSPVPVPPQTRRDYKAANGAPMSITKVIVPDYEAGFGAQDDAAPQLLELHDILASCAGSKEEWQILQMRAAGHSDAEISQVLRLPWSAVYMLRRELYRCFESKGEE